MTLGLAAVLACGMVDPPAAAPPAKPATPGSATTPPRTDARARQQQAAWRARFGDKTYRYLEDPAHHLVFATCLDETSHTEMQRMLAAQADQQAATLFGTVPDVEVFLAIAKPADAHAVIGGGTTTEGMYEHPLRRLVASDIGIVLRHEFTHLMHFGHMERLGQPHMLWVQEGLATLYEVYDLSADGSIVFLPSARHNQARQLASSRAFVPWAKLVTFSPDQFMAKSQALYPQVRSMFEYFADTGKLRRWYQRYTETFDKDRTGKLALEEVYGKPLAEIESDWRTWVLKRPAVDVKIDRTDRSLGVEVAAATDGVSVTKLDRRGAAARAGIRSGDVILAVDSKTVRSPREFLAAVAGLKADSVVVTVRRGQQRSDVTVQFSATNPVTNPAARAGVFQTVPPANAVGPAFARNSFLRAAFNLKVEGPCTSPSAPSTWI